MNLVRVGDHVTGTYVYNGNNGIIDGILSPDGYTLTGIWFESIHPLENGSFVFTLDSGLDSFTGTWGYGTSVDDGGSWNGDRAP